MGNPDFLNDEDFFDKVKREIEIRDTQKKEGPSSQEAATDLFAQPPFEEKRVPHPPAFKENLALEETFAEEDIFATAKRTTKVQDFQEDIKETLSLDQDEIKEEIILKEKSSEKNEYSAVDFYDEKQEKLNYKPFWIAGILILVLILAGIIGKNIFFPIVKTDEKKEIVQQPQTDTKDQVLSDQKAVAQTDRIKANETPKLSSEQLKRNAYFANLTAKNRQSLSAIDDLARLAENEVIVSGFLLYDREFKFEVFASNRDKLTKFNQKLKTGLKHKHHPITSNDRPDGVLVLYSVDFQSIAPASEQVQDGFNDPEKAKAWLSGLLQTHSLKIEEVKLLTGKKQEEFTVFELSTRVSGKYGNCVSFLNKLSKETRNIKVHKLSLNASDQKKFKEDKYQLAMIIKIFV